MPIARITDHVAAGQALLLQQYQEKPRIAALLASDTKQVQQLEDAIWSSIVGRLIDTAVGVQLDALGRIVGQRRDAASDEPFRSRIRARIRANRSNGTPDDVIAVAMLAAGVTPEQLLYTEHYPASFVVEYLTVLDPSVAPVIRELIASAKALSVGFAVLFSGLPEAETFAFAPGDTPVTDTARGFAAGEDPTVAPGGRWIDSA